MSFGHFECLNMYILEYIRGGLVLYQKNWNRTFFRRLSFCTLASKLVTSSAERVGCCVIHCAICCCPFSTRGARSLWFCLFTTYSRSRYRLWWSTPTLRERNVLCGPYTAEILQSAVMIQFAYQSSFIIIVYSMQSDTVGFYDYQSSMNQSLNSDG